MSGKMTGKVRGRPRSFDREASLDSAMKLFWRHGYEGSSIAELTRAMGCTAPTLYALFESKEKLYQEALQHFLNQTEDARQQLLNQSSAYVFLETYLRVAAMRYTDPDNPPGCMLATASLNCAPEHQGIVETASRLRRSNLDLLRAKLYQARAAGELPTASDIESLTRFYAAIVQGMSVQAVDGASREQLLGMAELALAAWPGSRLESQLRS